MLALIGLGGCSYNLTGFEPPTDRPVQSSSVLLKTIDGAASDVAATAWQPDTTAGLLEFADILLNGVRQASSRASEPSVDAVGRAAEQYEMALLNEFPSIEGRYAAVQQQVASKVTAAESLRGAVTTALAVGAPEANGTQLVTPLSRAVASLDEQIPVFKAVSHRLRDQRSSLAIDSGRPPFVVYSAIERLEAVTTQLRLLEAQLLESPDV